MYPARSILLCEGVWRRGLWRGKRETYPEMLYGPSVRRRRRPHEIRIRRICRPRELLTHSSAPHPRSPISPARQRTHPEPLANLIAKHPRFDARALGRLLDLEPVFVRACCEAYGHVWSPEACVACDDVGKEEGMEVAYVRCCGGEGCWRRMGRVGRGTYRH